MKRGSSWRKIILRILSKASRCFEYSLCEPFLFQETAEMWLLGAKKGQQLDQPAQVWCHKVVTVSHHCLLMAEDSEKPKKSVRRENDCSVLHREMTTRATWQFFFLQAFEEEKFHGTVIKEWERGSTEGKEDGWETLSDGESNKRKIL